MNEQSNMRPVLHPSSIGHFFWLQSCPMYLQWEYDEKAQEAIHRRDWEISRPSPVILDEGESFEIKQLRHLITEERRIIGLEGITIEDEITVFDERWPNDSSAFRASLVEELQKPAQENSDEGEILIHQPLFEGQIGAYTVRGMADFLRIQLTNEGVEATVLEVKSSSEQRVHHRYQATVYAMLLEDFARSEVEFASINCAIVTPDNSVKDGLDDVTQFDTTPYRAKLELKLAAGGSFDQTILDTRYDETTNRIAQRCSMCEYEELCMTRAVENQGLELLGLPAGTQEQLRQLGIETIEDFATLYHQPGDEASHRDFSPLEAVDEDLVKRVRQEADISTLQKRTQIAYRFLSEIDDDHGRDGPDFFPNHLQGTGYNLPKDNHNQYDIDWESNTGIDYPSESLVRVYLYVQKDFALNRVTLLSGIVTNSRTEETVQITELPNSLSESTRDKNTEEDRLFGSFFEDLTEAIQSVSPDWEDDYTEVDEPYELDPDEGFVHLYFYSEQQRNAMMEAIRRHPSADWRRPLRTLLGLRAGIDQEMVSIIQDDFRNRWALRYPGLGVIQAGGQFKPYNGEWFDWRETREDGSTAPLHEIFAADLFDGGVRHGPLDGSPPLDHQRRELLWTPEDRRLARWIYPTRQREVTQLPIGYLWGVYDKLNPDRAGDAARLEEFLYRSEETVERITKEDIRLIAEKFAEITEHIEGGIWNKSQYVNKEPIDLADLSKLSFEQRTLDEACIEYQQLEYHTHKTSLESYYTQPVEERIDAGSSVAFECTAVDEDEGVIEGQLLVSDLTRYDPESDDGLIGGPVSVGGGDFMVMTKLTQQGDRPEAVYNGDPTNIKHSPTVIISNLDETSGTVRIESPFKNGWPSGYETYTVWHKGWGTDEEAAEDDYSVHIDVGDRFIVDPSSDQLTQARAYEALEHAVDAPVRRWLRQLYQGDRDRIQVNPWDESEVQSYVDRMESAPGFDRPNPEQNGFITDVDHGILTLQGPPGTGKTEYTVAPAVLSRVHAAAETNTSMLGVVSAVSHGAVDEALKAIVDLRDECPVGSDDDVSIYRICSTSGRKFTHPDVTNVCYSEPDATEKLEKLYESHFAPDADPSGQALYFGPPVSIRSCLNKMLRVVDDAEHDNVRELMGSGASQVFDLAVIDEASMIDLPLCLLLGSFLTENGQLLLVGDHRQMQPIQRHEWEDEDREPIEKNVPFLSALDFLRYLRGEEGAEIEYLSTDPPELTDPDEALPVYRLRQTYRLPPESAQMHTDLFYEQDGIELESAGSNEGLPPVDGPMAEFLDTNDRVTLIVHDEAQSQKTNPIEQALITELLQPLGDIHEDVTAGVVVPFRAQRRDVSGSLPEEVQVDTVERFQGGQRDVMVLSMTAADRGYISQISEFLLDPRRFNVGASRMKRKLVVLASVGLFEESSNDITQFEQQEAWVNFYDALGGLSNAGTEYNLSELLSQDTWDEFISDADTKREPTVRVFSGYPFGAN